VHYVHMRFAFIKPTLNAPPSIHQTKQRDLMYGRRYIKCWFNGGKIATVSFVTSVCPPVRMHQLGSHWTGFQEIRCLNIFQKSIEKTQFFIKIWQEYKVLRMAADIRFWSYLSEFFLRWENFQTKILEKINTYILCSIIFFPPKIVQFVR
jgi:hypothetical protein